MKLIPNWLFVVLISLGLFISPSFRDLTKLMTEVTSPDNDLLKIYLVVVVITTGITAYLTHSKYKMLGWGGFLFISIIQLFVNYSELIQR